MKKYMLTDEEQSFLLPVLSDLESRKEIFFQFGQQFLKVLNGNQLQQKTYALFEFLLENKDKWLGRLMVPENYRNDNSITVGYIDYAVREYIGWNILYPKETDSYFNQENDGNVVSKANPAIRLVEKDKYTLVKKVIDGKTVSVKAKIDSEKQLKSGFSIAQKDNILNVVVACYVDPNDNIGIIKKDKPKVKEKEKETKKEKTKSKVKTKEKSESE